MYEVCIRGHQRGVVRDIGRQASSISIDHHNDFDIVHHDDFDTSPVESRFDRCFKSVALFFTDVSNAVERMLKYQYMVIADAQSNETSLF